MPSDFHTAPESEQLQLIELWHEAIWRGLSRQAIGVLLQLRYSPVDTIRRRANWILGRWYASRGDFQLALEYFYEITRIERYPQGKVLVAIAFCELQLGRPQVIHSLLTTQRFTNVPATDLLMLKANSLSTSDNDQKRLQLINQMLSHGQLMRIQLRDPALGISALNLQGTEVVTPAARVVRNEEQTALVSVIVPTFNAAASIDLVLLSLLEQTWPNIEIIVVDDASDDDTVAQVKALAEIHPCIHVLAQTENRGAYPTRNIGMRAARGNYVMVNDSDDWSHPEKIERQMLALLNEKQAVGCLSSWVRVSDALAFLGLWMVGGKFVEVNHSSLLIRRSILEDVGYWDEVRVSADSEFIWRCQQVYGAEAIVDVLPDVPLAFSVVSQTSLTQDSATHVSTIYFGGRRLYREACQWWHRQGPPKLGVEKPFPLPLGLLPTIQQAPDVLYILDATALNSRLAAHLQLMLARYLNKGRQIAVLHWPSKPEHCLEPIADEVFQFMQTHQLNFAHAGLVLDTATIVFSEFELLTLVPDRLPCVLKPQEVEVIGAQALYSEAYLKTLYRSLRLLFSTSEK